MKKFNLSGKIVLFELILLSGWISVLRAAEPSKPFTIARVWYQGGGDWYNDPCVIPNLLSYLAKVTGMRVATTEARVKLTDEKLFSYPILYLTGHGNIVFSETEARDLRNYLIHGGFLYADDDYGMDKYFRREIKKVFPEKKLIELPFLHDIYHIQFDFPRGLPKTHEHYPGPPHGYGIFYNGRMVVYYTFNTNISDGWADPNVHHDPLPVRIQALKMGVNIVVWALFN